MHGAVRHGEEVALAKALHGSPTGKATWWGRLSLCLSFSTDATRKLRWKRTNLNRAARTPTASAACGPASLRGAARLGQDKSAIAVRVFLRSGHALTVRQLKSCLTFEYTRALGVQAIYLMSWSGR